MTESRKSTSRALCARIPNWRAGRLLRFCWALVVGGDLAKAGFNVQPECVDEVREIWPISTLVRVFTSLGADQKRLSERLLPFVREFLPALYTRLNEAANEDSRLQFLWLNMAAKKGLDGLVERLLTAFHRGLQPPKPRTPPLYYKPSKPSWQISEAKKQRSRDLAKGRRLVMAQFTEALLASIAAPQVQTAIDAGHGQIIDDGSMPEWSRNETPPQQQSATGPPAVAA